MPRSSASCKSSGKRRQHGDAAGHVEAADHHREAVGAEPAGEIERARKLVRLHADQADHAGAGVTDAFGHALDIDDSVALVASLDLDRDIGAERALLRALFDQAMDAGEAVGGQCRAQPLDDVAIRVVMRRLDQNDAKALGRACVHASSPKGTHTGTPRAPAALRRTKGQVTAQVGALCVFGGRFATVFGRNSPCRNDMWTDELRRCRRRSAFEPAITATLRGEKLPRRRKRRGGACFYLCASVASPSIS